MKNINITSVVTTWIEVDPKGKLPNFVYYPLSRLVSWMTRNEYLDIRHTLELMTEDGRQIPSLHDTVGP